MNEEIRQHPLNAKGKYYIDQDNCTCCAACEYVAPNNFKYEDGYTYVFKQPETPDEKDLCEEAVMCFRTKRFTMTANKRKI